ncbi:MAG: MobH family relaxase [Burkholderiaceae bacterium]|nr:MobH family relaxase [Burkholderiaceae bacterium]
MRATPSEPSSYSSSDPGFPAVSVEEVLQPHADLVARIKLCYGADRDTFERDVLGLIHRYAAFVHLLPATADNYFNSPGGLLRLGLETGFFSLQGTDAHIFSGRLTISARRQLEPRWRLGTFIAGLCCELHRALSHVMATDAQGVEWPPCLTPLATWLQQRHTPRYFLRWRPQAIETRSLGLFALPHVVAPEVLQHLCQDNTVIVPHLMASIGGLPVYRDKNVLDELVRRSLALVIDRNLVANADRYGSPQFGSHLERFLVDALRRLAVTDSAWIANREKSRVWFGPDGLFLLWPGAAEDISALLEADHLPGIPKAPETMREVLLDAGVLLARDTGSTMWIIHPPGSKAGMEAVRLASPVILFTGLDPAPPPLAQALTTRHVEATAKPPTSRPPLLETSASQQLSLLPPDCTPPPPSSPPAPLSTPEPDPPEPSFALRAPLRLNPVVRDALTAIAATLNSAAGPAQCCTVAQGLFVPLDRFDQRGVPPSLALRALADVRMLVSTGLHAPPTLSRDFNGSPTVGLVIDPRFIEGLDLSGFSLSVSEPA